MTTTSAAMTRRRLLQCAAGAAAAMGVGGCGVDRAKLRPETSVADTVPSASVSLVGDSISWLSRIELEAALAAHGFGRIEFDALPGRHIAEGDESGLDVLDRVLAAGVTADVWIIELGTNDLGNYDANGYAELIDLVVERIPAPTPMVWVDTYASFRADAATEFNAILREKMIARGAAAVADWHAKCVEIGPTTLIPDGLHPTAEGFPIFAEVTVAPINVVA